MSLLPELLKAPRRTASGLSGLEPSITGSEDRDNMKMGARKTVALAPPISSAERILFPATDISSNMLCETE